MNLGSRTVIVGVPFSMQLLPNTTKDGKTYNGNSNIVLYRYIMVDDENMNGTFWQCGQT